MSGTTEARPRRILVVANETVASDILHTAIRAHVDDAAGGALVRRSGTTLSPCSGRSSVSFS